MKTQIVILVVAFTCTSCKGKVSVNINEKDIDPVELAQDPADTVPRVTGIGGIFFKADDPKAINEWYGKNLGLSIDEYGSPFEFRNARRPEEINYLRWSPFEKNTDYFDPSGKEFMINYRVKNLEGLLNKLRKNGVTILDDIEQYDYGKFVHIMDPEGNKIELWEPVDSSLKKLGVKTTK
jgi:predicted enzyme related to lactoylglutathione lyase